MCELCFVKYIVKHEIGCRECWRVSVTLSSNRTHCVNFHNHCHNGGSACIVSRRHRALVVIVNIFITVAAVVSLCVHCVNRDRSLIFTRPSSSLSLRATNQSPTYAAACATTHHRLQGQVSLAHSFILMMYSTTRQHVSHLEVQSGHQT